MKDNDIEVLQLEAMQRVNQYLLTYNTDFSVELRLIQSVPEQWYLYDKVASVQADDLLWVAVWQGSGKDHPQAIWILYSEGNWAFREVKVPIQEVQTYVVASKHIGEEIQYQPPKLEPQELRQLSMKLIGVRFPILEQLAMDVIDSINETTTLKRLISRIAFVKTLEEAQQYLLEVRKN